MGTHSDIHSPLMSLYYTPLLSVSQLTHCVRLSLHFSVADEKIFQMAEGPSSSEIERDLKLLLGIPCSSFDKPANQQVPISADISVHDVSNSHKKQNSLFGEMDEKRINNRLKQKDLSHRQNLQADMYPQEQPTLHNMQRSNIRESHSWKESRKAKQKDVTKGSIFNINPDRKISILKPDHSSNMQERDHGKMDGHNAQNNNGSTSKMCAKVVEMMKSASAEYHLKGNANNSVLKKPEELANEDKVFPLKRRSPKFPDAKYFCRLCEYHCMSDADCLTHIKTEKHQWRKEISIAETKLKKLPKPTLSHLLAIERALDHVYECHGLTKAETQQRQMFVQEVENYLQKDLKGLKLHLYGSSITGFGLKSSDVNIDLETPTGMNLANGLRIVFECLKKSDKYKDVQSDFLTKVPSVYFCSNDSYALKCQITVNSLFAQQTSRLLSIYGAMDETARKLGVAFRFWSKLCHVDCQEEGTLPAYCTALMTVYFLQRCQPAVLPVFLIQTEEARVGHIFELIQKIGQNFRTTNTMGLGELWLELLKFYCQGFDSSRTVISIRHDGKLTRAAKNWRTKRLAIEDPFSTKRNIARSNLSDGKGPAIICSICEKEGHLKNNCPEEELPPLLPLPAMTQESLQLLNDTLLQIPKDFGPTVFDTEERKIIVKGLECLIRERYPEASLHLFGSSCNGFGFQNSDLDICITFGNHPNADGLDCVSIIESLAQKLRENKQLYGVVAITTAKVPIVKFKLKNSNLEGDISLYNTLAQHNTKLLKMYTKIDSRVAILGYALKVFAKVCEIGDASKGSLSSYAYILMLLHYLQQCDPPVIPVLQELHEGEKPVTMVDGWNAWFYDDFDNLKNTWKHYGQNKLSVAELWIGLFIFYTEKFNLQMVVTIRQHSPLTRFEKLWNGKCLAIEGLYLMTFF
ncbi:TUT [Acanthosepion pharaonis]|uniref:TUT n=1 Tax=Acanthosepion pharaonis TaxID=158019 RepID=A0A812CD24_ACAPH|nr:TUT [Sepia pharaonis]